MEKDKYDFIVDLLENNKLNLSQKERILRLSAQEFKKEGDKKDKKIIKRIEEIENRLNNLKKEQNTPIKPIREQKKLPEPNPKHVADFMSLFNQRNGLKYLTHDYDENFEFEIDKFLDTAKDVFLKKTTEGLYIPSSLWEIVNQFAFTSEQVNWSSISEDYKKNIPLKIGWTTKEFRDWSKQNNLHPIRNNEYKKIINDFKRITRIESPNLERLIDTTIESVFGKDLGNFNIEKTNLAKADFYSHIGNLKIAFETIFEEIFKRGNSTDKRNISIKYERKSSNDYFLRKVIITHHSSFPSKELKLLISEWQQKGNMGKINKKLKGYCHWSVETKIEDNPVRINILKDNNTPKSEKIETADGFCHILTFYYK